jgi:alkylhydroperoxidase family enzyme
MTEIANRLGPRPISEWSDADLEVMRGRLTRAEKYLTRSPDAPPLPNLLGLFGHHPKLSSSFMGFSGLMLDEPLLDPREREILILRTAYRSRSHYEWAQHVRIGYETGLTKQQVAAIPAGAAHEVWTEHERLLLAATDELIDERRLGEANYAALAQRYSPAELLELLFVVGSYLCLALVLNSVDLPPDGNVPYELGEGEPA